MSFQNKYLKYKNKYLDLKNQFVSKGGASGNIRDPLLSELRYSISSALMYGTSLDHLDDITFIQQTSSLINKENECKQVKGGIKKRMQFILDNIPVQEDYSKDPLLSELRSSISSALGFGTQSVLDYLDDREFIEFATRKLNKTYKYKQVQGGTREKLQFILDYIHRHDPLLSELRYSISSALGFGTQSVLDYLDDREFIEFATRKLNKTNEYKQVQGGIRGKMQFILDNIPVPDTKATDNYLISLLWYNKEKGPIPHLNKKQIHPRDGLLRAYKMFKEKYNNPNVILFLNFDKIVEDDFKFFRRNNVVIEDVNEFNVFKTNPKLEQLFNPTRYNRTPCLVYVYVDMMKILIQYEKMVYQHYDYVIFSDYVIQDTKTLDNNEPLICQLPSFIKEFTKDKLFDPMTIKLLDNFGYLMNGHGRANVVGPTDKLNRTKYEQDPINNIHLIKIGDELISMVNGLPENRFLMSKNTPTTIKAIKEYFIDYLFCSVIFNNPPNNNNYVYNSYIFFYYYLNFLNGITNIEISISKSDLDRIAHDFKENIDYITISNDKIKIESESDRLSLYFIKREARIDLFLTTKGEKMIKELNGYIFPIMNATTTKIYGNMATLMPMKCVPAPTQINSGPK